jgi:hypothetical protein
MQQILNSDIGTILLWIAAIGVGWIVLRFLLKLAGKIFAFGCFVIVLIGLVLLAMQFFQGA